MSNRIRLYFNLTNTLRQVILILRLYALYNCSHRFAQVAKCAFGLQLLMLFGYAAYILSTSLGSCTFHYAIHEKVNNRLSGNDHIGRVRILRSIEPWSRVDILGPLGVVSAYQLGPCPVKYWIFQLRRVRSGPDYPKSTTLSSHGFGNRSPDELVIHPIVGLDRIFSLVSRSCKLQWPQMTYFLESKLSISWT